MKEKFLAYSLLILFLSCTQVKKEYFDDGKVKIIAQYKDNKINGLYKVYYKDGSKKIISQYSVGKLNGFKIVYYPNGNIKWYCTYKNDKENGTFKKYFQNNKISSIAQFRDGLQNGYTCYYDSINGLITDAIEYKYGKQIGNHFEYYQNGKLKTYLYQNDTIPLFLLEFNENNEITKEYRGLYIKMSKDTFKANEEIKAFVKIFGPVEKNYHVVSFLFGFDHNSSSLDANRNEFIFKHKACSPGVYALQINAFCENYNNPIVSFAKIIVKP
jgi:hypothetical protein